PTTRISPVLGGDWNSRAALKPDSFNSDATSTAFSTVENPWSDTTKTSVFSRRPRRDNSPSTCFSLRSELASAVKAFAEPGPAACCEKSGSLNQSKEYCGTPLVHNEPVRASVVH